jgi:hypothetical protein
MEDSKEMRSGMQELKISQRFDSKESNLRAFDKQSTCNLVSKIPSHQRTASTAVAPWEGQQSVFYNLS